MALIFEWDPEKARINLAKHRVSFEEAATVMRDPLSLTIQDALHPTQEQRFVTVGHSHRGRTLVVVHSDRGERVRIISARVASRAERKQYEEE